MKDKLLHNLGLKIISCIVAVILWLVVVNVSDPVVDTTYSDIPLTVTGSESLAAEGKVSHLLPSAKTEEPSQRALAVRR